jgi:hypothetical protein
MSSGGPGTVPSVSLQLEDLIGHCRCDTLKLLRPNLRAGDQVRAADRVPPAPAPQHGRQTATRKDTEVALHRNFVRGERGHWSRNTFRLRGGIEPGGIPVPALQVPRTAQRLNQEPVDLSEGTRRTMKRMPRRSEIDFRQTEADLFIRIHSAILCERLVEALQMPEPDHFEKHITLLRVAASPYRCLLPDPKIRHRLAPSDMLNTC